LGAERPDRGPGLQNRVANPQEKAATIEVEFNPRPKTVKALFALPQSLVHLASKLHYLAIGVKRERSGDRDEKREVAVRVASKASLDHVTPLSGYGSIHCTNDSRREIASPFSTNGISHDPPGSL